MVCRHGYFGMNCGEQCGCRGNSSCDAVTGRYFCGAGKTGKTCDQGDVNRNKIQINLSTGL